MKPRRTLADREDVLGVALLSPALAYVILLVGIPFVLAIVLSFSDATAGSLSFGWVGLRNYAAIVADPIFLRALGNTAIVTIGTQALVVVLATAAAQVFRATFPGRRYPTPSGPYFNLPPSNISHVATRTLMYSGSTTNIYAHFMGWFGEANHQNVGYTSSSPIAGTTSSSTPIASEDKCTTRTS